MQRQKQRIAYFDCYSGISGDMILGALVDLGVKLDSIRKGLKAIDLKGYKISSKAVKRGGISGTKVTVTVDKPKKGHHHHGRHFSGDLCAVFIKQHAHIITNGFLETLAS